MNQPNIILIIAEQFRGDCLRIAGNQHILTPNLDNLAAEGAYFPRAYTTCPTCIPARRSILSGQFPATHGMRGYQEKVHWDHPRSTAEVLREQGYHTYFVGRDLHQHPVRKRFGYDHMVIGSDYKDWLTKQIPFETGHTSSGGFSDSPVFASGIMHNDYTARPWPYDEGLHMTNWTMMQAKKFMQIRDPERPFFLTISFMAAHPPLTPPNFYFERYLRMAPPEPIIGDWAIRPKNDGVGIRSDGIEYDNIPDGNIHMARNKVCLEDEMRRSMIAGYYGLINHMDDQIRRLIYSINGIDLDNTAVLFVSDHGEMLGDHYMWKKIMPYEGSAHIPFIVRLPDSMGSPRGQKITEAVCLEDVMPTILDIAGAPIPESVEGKSLLPLISRGESLERPFLHIEHAPFHQTLTDGRIKFIWFVDTGEEQLFDLDSDPFELKNLIDHPAYADVKKHWRERLIDELKSRPEGFVENNQLKPHVKYPAVLD